MDMETVKVLLNKSISQPMKRKPKTQYSYLEADPSVPILVDNLEHFPDKDVLGPHAEGAGELCWGEGGAGDAQ